MPRAPARDHYEVLEVERTASAAEIKAAYRRLALQHHPDRNAGDRRAEEKFKEISLAYAVLGDEDRRAHYDRFGAVASDLPFGGEADIRVVTDFFDAIFGDLFGTGRKRVAGQDVRYTLELGFAEAALGCQKEIRFTRTADCPSCRGTGAEGGAAGLVPCDRCQGKGYVRPKSGFLSARRPCQACAGSGEVARVRCQACAGTGQAEAERVFTVRIPPGSQAGSTQRVSGEGSPGRRGGPAGDLHVIVRVKPDPFYRQEGDILVIEVPLSVEEAALGTEIDIPLLDEQVRMKIPPGTQSGAVFRVRRKGLPRPAGGRGDAHVQVAIEVPTAVPDEARALLERLGPALGAAAYPRRAAFRARTQTHAARGG
ncbi:MAG: molecular chaperone DnaJ [Deltaproteobacteria bacterium]|nr:molecular chaperone DnaJ [Deltaproteobacteria bacterium]